MDRAKVARARCIENAAYRNLAQEIPERPRTERGSADNIRNDAETQAEPTVDKTRFAPAPEFRRSIQGMVSHKKARKSAGCCAGACGYSRAEDMHRSTGNFCAFLWQ